jgi:hypothetical protein
MSDVPESPMDLVANLEESVLLPQLGCPDGNIGVSVEETLERLNGAAPDGTPREFVLPREASSGEPVRGNSLADSVRARIEPLGGIELESLAREAILNPVDFDE